MNTWHDVAAQADLFEDAGIAVTVQGQEVALFSVAGQVHAIDNACTHGPARLCEGWVEGAEVECPLHQGRFSLETGEATFGPACESVRVWPVRIDNGRVWVSLDAPLNL
ncbi:MAG: non-heme iron oxygenase ferredoxin subunit [Alphaproteobacteria bacterium]|nr:non-heme iron oxygenase ferredoxin subunit [Alphaproteobacteria bacterium]